VTAVGTDTLDLRLASGELDQQDLCSPTTELLAVDFTSNPYVTVESQALSLWMGGLEIIVEEARLTGRFQSDSEAVTGVGLSGVIDTAPLGDLFGIGPDPAAVCSLVATFGVSCLECPDGSGPYCISVVVEDGYGPEISTDLVARTLEDIEADTSCP
jgi:hypothetical protein